MLAPIPFAGRSEEAPLKALDQEQVVQEAGLRPRVDEHIKVGGSEFVWKATKAEDSVLDFNRFLGKRTAWSAAYAVSYIRSDADRTGLSVKVGSDDAAKVYLDGKEIYRNDFARACVPDQDVVSAGVSLRRGLNVVVFKVVNEILGWQGSVRFTDASGEPIKGLRVTLDPEASTDSTHQ